MARLPKHRRRAVQGEIPPVKCGARSKGRGGAPCDQWAVVGTTVCPMHGGQAPQVVTKAEQRISLAERLKHQPRRQPWEVMEETAHIADVLLQDARSAIEAGVFVADDLDKLVSSLERAHRLSNVNVNTGLSERKQRFAEGQAMQMHAVFSRVLAGLALTPTQQALVPHLLKQEIDGVLVGSKSEQRAIEPARLAS